MAQRWGDVLDDSDEETDIQQQSTPSGLVIPPTHKSRIDSKGIQIVTSYRQHPANPKQLLKTITKIRVTTQKVREAKAVEERRHESVAGFGLLEPCFNAPQARQVGEQHRDSVAQGVCVAESDAQDVLR